MHTLTTEILKTSHCEVTVVGRVISRVDFPVAMALLLKAIFRSHFSLELIVSAHKSEHIFFSGS
jgi:hypothetical protein